MAETVSFGTWLRQKRRELDLSQKAFANQVGCAEITVRRMEAGEYKPSKELALTLFDKLGIRESERPQWVRFARGLADYPGHQAISSPPRAEKTNLPVPLTSFIGRKKEQEEIRNLLSKGRLITVLGPGGIGKTRLSLQTGQELLIGYPDGVWFVPLAPLESARTLVPALAKALDFSFYLEQQSPRQQLLDYLREKHILLILDSFEQLIGEGAGLIGEILSTAPHLKMLVTSRERLNLQGEQLYRVSGMHIPEAGDLTAWNAAEEQTRSFSALHLFEERASRVRQDFRLTRDNLAAVTEICKLVNGMPLGIELAAAWVEILLPGEIAAEIIRSLDFLETDQQNVSDRQRSIRAVFESSWKLLSEEEQTVFRALTVFRGSFSREAAQRVSGASLHMLLGLANKSWLQQMEAGRFQLHDVLRYYGYERLQTYAEEWQAVNDRHASYYIDFVEMQEQDLRGAKQFEAANNLNKEFGNNIQAAWNWSIERRKFGDVVNKMLPGLFHFCMIRSQVEILVSMAERARKAIPESRSREALLQQATLETVEIYFEVSRILRDDPPQERLANLWAQVQKTGLKNEMGFWFIVLIAAYREGIGFTKIYQGFRELEDLLQAQSAPWFTGYALLLLSADILSETSPEEGQKYMEAALEIFQESGALHEQGMTFVYLGQIARDKNCFDEAVRYLQAAREFFAKAGDSFRAGYTRWTLAETQLKEGFFDLAFHGYEEQRRIYEKIGYRRGIGFSFSWESLAASRYSTLEHALETRQRSLAIAREVGHLNDIAWFTWELGELYRLIGDIEQANSCYQQAFPDFERLQDYNGMGHYYRGLGDLALQREHWEEACNQFQKSIAVLEQEHRYMQAWSLAYSQAGLGSSLIGLGNFSKAGQVLQNSIRNAEKCGNKDLMHVTLMGFARLYAAVGKSEQAVGLAAFISTHRLSWNETKSQARAVLEKISPRLPEEVTMAATSRGEAMTIEEAVAYVIDG